MNLTVEQANTSMPFAKALGVEFVEIRNDRVRSRLAWSEGLCTVGGAMHGGAVMALADATGAVAAFVNLPAEASGTTTISSATNFIRALREGHANAESLVLHRGRTTLVIETAITDDLGRTVAKVTQTQAVLT